jgi:hypothetical protein
VRICRIIEDEDVILGEENGEFHSKRHVMGLWDTIWIEYCFDCQAPLNFMICFW